MSSLLEQRYRRVLRLLPDGYRRSWEEDMVATFLQRAYAAVPEDPEGVELGRPDRAEVASVAALALRLRLGGTGAPPRYRAWGAAVRRVALLGLFAHAVGAIVGVLLLVWSVKRLPGLVVPTDPAATSVDPAHGWLSLSGLLWIPAYLSILHGHRRAGVILALLALLPPTATSVWQLARVDHAYALSRITWLAFAAIPVLALIGYHRDVAPVRPRPWLIALPATAVAAFVLLLLAQPSDGHDALLDWPGLWFTGLTIGAGAYLVAATRRHTPDRPYWPLALALLAIAVLALRTAMLWDYLTLSVSLPGRDTVVILDLAETIGLLTLALGLGTHGLRTVRHLDDTVPGH